MTSVALVDDHELLRTGLAAIINSFDGFKVILEANNGQHFIEKAATKAPPDIVLLDITMPVMDGYDTAVWIKQNMPRTRVLVLSCWKMTPQLSACLKTVPAAIYSKTVNPKYSKRHWTMFVTADIISMIWSATNSCNTSIMKTILKEMHLY